MTIAPIGGYSRDCKAMGMNPTSVAEGAKALAELSTALEAGIPYGLILTDMHMPKMDESSL